MTVLDAGSSAGDVAVADAVTMTRCRQGKAHDWSPTCGVTAVHIVPHP